MGTSKTRLVLPDGRHKDFEGVLRVSKGTVLDGLQYGLPDGRWQVERQGRIGATLYIVVRRTDASK